MRLSFCPTLVSFPVRQAMSRVFFTVLCVVFLLGSVGRTQTITATILGIVEDTTGAVIPGVTVEVRNTDTGVTRTVEADARGAMLLHSFLWATTKCRLPRRDLKSRSGRESR